MPLTPPTPKAASAGIAAALSIVLVWILGLCHITVSPEVASAITTVVAFFAAYFAPRSKPI